MKAKSHSVIWKVCALCRGIANHLFIYDHGLYTHALMNGWPLRTSAQSLTGTLVAGREVDDVRRRLTRLLCLGGT